MTGPDDDELLLIQSQIKGINETEFYITVTNDSRKLLYLDRLDLENQNVLRNQLWQIERTRVGVKLSSRNGYYLNMRLNDRANLIQNRNVATTLTFTRRHGQEFMIKDQADKNRLLGLNNVPTNQVVNNRVIVDSVNSVGIGIFWKFYRPPKPIDPTS